jgi:hypothetical protein
MIKGQINYHEIHFNSDYIFKGTFTKLFIGTSFLVKILVIQINPFFSVKSFGVISFYI